MKYLKEDSKKRNTGLWIAVIFLSAAVIVLTVLLLWKQVPTESADQDVTTESTGTTTQQPQLPVTQESTDSAPSGTEAELPANMRVVTPYCDLHFPADWGDQVTATVNEYDGGCTAAFVGTTADKQAYLFVILLEEGENQGTAIGSVTTDSGTTAWVYVEMNELLTDETWTQTQSDEILAMQEGINYLLEVLSNDPVFTPVN